MPDVLSIVGCVKSVVASGEYRTEAPMVSNRRCLPVPSLVEPRNWPGTSTRLCARPYGRPKFVMVARRPGQADAPDRTSGDDALRSAVGVSRTGFTFATSCDDSEVTRAPWAVCPVVTTDRVVRGWIGSYWVTWGSSVPLGPVAVQKLPRSVVTALNVEVSVSGSAWRPVVGSVESVPGSAGAVGDAGGVPVAEVLIRQNGRP